MTGGECDGLVEKEQLGVVIGCPLFRVTASELQDAGDPGLAPRVPDDVAGTASFVQSPPIAQPCSAAPARDDVAAGRDPVACGRHPMLSRSSSARWAAGPPR